MIWAGYGQTIPILGFGAMAQIGEIAGALRHCSLAPTLLAEFDRLLVWSGAD